VLVPSLSFSEFGKEAAQSKPSVNEPDIYKNQGRGALEPQEYVAMVDGTGRFYIYIDHLRHTATNLRLSTGNLRKASFFPL